MKTKVRMKHDGANGKYHSGDEGYIDGYVLDVLNRVWAVVVILRPKALTAIRPNKPIIVPVELDKLEVVE